MLKLNFQNTETLTFLLTTILGIINEEVTVFYVIYLFWAQELLRTLVDFFYILFLQKKTFSENWQFIKISFGSFFILWVYFAFIAVLFGFMLNRNNSELLINNIQVLTFHNLYFNITILVFLAQYIYFRSKTNNAGLQLHIFNFRHIILHISIILGALIQLAIVPKLHIETKWTAALVILPFLLLKLFFDRLNKSTENKI